MFVLDRFARCPPARVMRVRVRHLFVSKYLVRKSKTAPVRSTHGRVCVERDASNERRSGDLRLRHCCSESSASEPARPLHGDVTRSMSAASALAALGQAAVSLAPRLRARDAKESVSKLHRGRSVFDGKILSAHVERWRSSHAIKRHIEVVRSGMPRLEPLRRCLHNPCRLCSPSVLFSRTVSSRKLR